MNIYLIIILLISFLFLFASHPVTIGIVLLIQTILVRLITLYFFFNSWFSYIVFLILIGGLLILFIYITRIASNEKFKFNINLIYLIFIYLIIILFIKMKFNIYLPIKSENFFQFLICLSKFLQPYRNIILLFLIVYLFITLIAAVKISITSGGPLRQIFN